MRVVATRLQVGTLVAGATCATWFLLLPHDWKLVTVVGPHGGEKLRSPVAVWRWIAVTIVLALLVAAAAYWRHPIVGAFTVGLPVFILWCVQASAADDSGLWGIGALFVLLPMLTVAVTLAAGAGVLLRRRTHHASALTR
jgi:hypothetical protein